MTSLLDYVMVSFLTFIHRWTMEPIQSVTRATWEIQTANMFGAGNVEKGKNFLPDNLTYYMEECYVPEPVCPNTNITFWLYTKYREKAHRPYHKLDLSDPGTIKTAPFSRGRGIKVIIHGYTGWIDYTPNIELRTAYFHSTDVNIIAINYAPLAMPPCYPQAVNSARLIANCTAQLLDHLVAYQNFRPEQIHIIGFSLGAQIASFVGEFFKAGKIRRITGLDPGLPLFDSRDESKKLDSSDAEFVDVIHTNVAWKGQLESCGHVDFYVNGGYFQPSCLNAPKESASSCNHVKAVDYFAESITTDIGFYGLPCSSYFVYLAGLCTAGEEGLVIMGEFTPPTARGTYYLETRDQPPYAFGMSYQRKNRGLKVLKTYLKKLNIPFLGVAKLFGN